MLGNPSGIGGAGFLHYPCPGQCQSILPFLPGRPFRPHASFLGQSGNGARPGIGTLTRQSHTGPVALIWRTVGGYDMDGGSELLQLPDRGTTSPMTTAIYSPQVLTDLSPGPNSCGSITADPDRAQGLAAVTGKAITQEPAQSRRAGGSTHLTTSSMPHTRMGAYVYDTRYLDPWDPPGCPR